MIIVTGVSSFVGSQLALGLQKRGAKVAGILSKPFETYEGVRRTRLEKVQATCTLQVLDLTNENETRRFIAEQKPKVWIHHAGFATKYASLDYDLKQGHAVNVAPLYYIYEALQQSGAEGIVVTGSSMEYAFAEEGAREQDLCLPGTPYGLSKLTETLAAMQLASRYNLATRVARVFIPFGPLDSEEKLIPQMAIRLKKGTPVSLVPGEVRRDFLHVEDLVEAYATLIGDLKNGGAEIYNVSNGTPTSIAELAHSFAKQLHAPQTLLQFGVYSIRAGEGLVTWGRNEKLKNLGWKPKPLEERIQEYLKSYEIGI